MDEQSQQKDIQIRAQDADLKGVYSNIMQVMHTQEEFVLDFFNIVGQTGSLASRVIISPGHLKRMITALQENLRQYEEKFGTITAAEGVQDEFGFRSDK